MGEFTREEIAQRAGVPVEFVDRLAELGIIAPGEADALFSRGSVRTTRFVRGLEQGGVPLDAVSSVIKSGDLSFEFFEVPYWERFGGLTEKSYRDLSAETGLSLDLLQSTRESMGYARPKPDDPVREDELLVVPLLKMILEMGVESGAVERQIRIWGESLRRIAEADRDFYRTHVVDPLLAGGLTWSDTLMAATVASETMVPLLDPALIAMYHAQSEHTWMANSVEGVEAILERTGLHQNAGRLPAMCFVDLSGYTRYTEERGDEAAAEISGKLASVVQRGSHERGGRPVKWLGDGVMVFFSEPAAAVRFAVEMRDRIPAADLPAAHTGIAAGPVIFQDGDYFGRTVNMASRIAAFAKAGQVLVSDDARRMTPDSGVDFVDIGLVELKGVPQAVRLHEARRQD